MNSKLDRAKIIAPPPLLGVACIALAFLARHYKPLPLFTNAGPLQIGLGVGLCLLAAIIIFIARRQMVAQGTHPNPYRPTHSIVVTNIYRFSRNPIYIAFLLVVLAFAFFANSLWFIVMDGILFCLLHFGVVKREENYLSQKFGDAYKEYCRQVRRWI
jgi:protein-S-isoprenylcysteine O-methyltransferase Ste14